MFLAALFASLAVAQGAAPVLTPEGYWINAAQSVVIRVAPCSGAGWCGTVAWASGKATEDARRGGTSPLVGAQILDGFIGIAPNRWKGRVFVPDLRKRSTAELRQTDADHLVVRGCAVGGILCKSQRWSRTAPPAD